MKKMLKITGFVFAGLIVLTVVLLVAAKLLITPERVKKAVLPVAEKALNRQVNIGEIGISLFSGISIEDFSVMMREGDGTFVSAESLVLRYKLWPLLKKQVVVDELSLINPDIRVIRNKDGTFNFSDLLKNKKEIRASRPGNNVEASVALAQEKNDRGSAIDLMVSRVQITGGRLSFTDKAVSGEPFSCEVSSLDASARNISLKESFPFKLKGSLNEAPVSVSGIAEPAGQKVVADVRISDLEALDFEPYFRGIVPAGIASAKLALETSVEADSDEVRSIGTLRAENIDMILDGLPDAPFENAGLALDHDLAVEPGAQNIRIRNLDADLNGISINASGTVASYGSKPEIDISLDMPETEAQKILAAIPENLAKTAADMKPSGTVQAEIRIAGPAENPQSLLESGRVRLDGLGGLINNLKTAATGDIIFSGDLISSKELEVKLGGDTALLNFEITEFFSDPVRIVSSITADSLDLDHLITAAGGSKDQNSENDKKGTDKNSGSDRKQSNKTNRPAEESIGPLDLPVRAKGRVQVREARYKDLPLKNLLIDYTLVDNLLTVENFSANVADGEAKADASINLGQKNMEYRANLLMQDIKSGQIIAALYPKGPGIVSGDADIKGNFSGKGIQTADIRRNLTGQSNFQIVNGSISGEEITGQIVSVLGAGKLETLDFESFKGNVKIESGKAKIQGDYDSEDMKMKPSGMIGLDGSLDLSLNLRLASGFSDRISTDSLAGRLLADKQGWTRVPVAVAGTLSAPRFALDSSAVRQQIKEKGTEKILEEGIKKLFK